MVAPGPVPGISGGQEAEEASYLVQGSEATHTHPYRVTAIFNTNTEYEYEYEYE